MTLEQLEEVVRDNGAYITCPDNSQVTEEWCISDIKAREARGENAFRIWYAKKLFGKCFHKPYPEAGAVDLRQVVYDQVPPMPAEETPF
jgi:hypothetical protein